MRVLHCYNTSIFNIFFGFCPQAWRVRTGLSSGDLVWWNFFHFRFKNSRIWFKFGFSESCHGNRQFGQRTTSTVVYKLFLWFFKPGVLNSNLNRTKKYIFAPIQRVFFQANRLNGWTFGLCRPKKDHGATISPRAVCCA